MTYTAQQLKELQPQLVAAIKQAKGPLRAKGFKLVEAARQVTRLADLVAPFAGSAQMENTAASFLIPHIQSYINEVNGRGATHPLVASIPGIASAVKAIDVKGLALRLMMRYGGSMYE